VKPEHQAAYDRSRKLTSKAFPSVCYAPHTNIFFDMKGYAKACCWSRDKHAFGNVQIDSLDDIWSGIRATQLRRATEAYRFDLGCDACKMQTQDGWTETASMRVFDGFPVFQADPQWPQRMEFSISNSCNLECVMCSGLFSSAIRAHREKLPPMATVYPASFFASLEKYLPHLVGAKFLGGEPFLITEYYKIWDMMVANATHVGCHITTNGTVFSGRVARYMERLNFSFAVSLDGATKKTVESIRVNANFDRQMEILKKLRDYTNERKTNLSLTFCFMRQNWHEFGEFCLMADAWNCGVFVNRVNNPTEFSMNSMSYEDLYEVIKVMETQAGELGTTLQKNRAVWFGEFRRLQLMCERKRS